MAEKPSMCPLLSTEVSYEVARTGHTLTLLKSGGGGVSDRSLSRSLLNCIPFRHLQSDWLTARRKPSPLVRKFIHTLSFSWQLQ